MVLPGERDYMETRPERSKTLHNFTFLNLKWGSQRHLRCMKIDSASENSGGGSSGAGDHRLRRRSSPLRFQASSEVKSVRFGDGDINSHRRLRAAPSGSAKDGGEEGIGEFREKIMSDLRTVAEKMTESIFSERALAGEEEEEEQAEEEKEKKNQKKRKEREVSPAAAATVEMRPWNLRKRRAACKAPITGAGNSDGNQFNGFNHINNKGLRIEDERRVNSSPVRNDSAKSSRTRERNGVTAAAAAVAVAETKLTLPLTRKEIEEDFMVMLGHRPPRRPKKHPKTVQKHLDFLFPGVYLTEVTLDTYKVPEPQEDGKR